jgi:hypothetical protein
MKRLGAALVVAVTAAAPMAGTAWADNFHGQFGSGSTGQPDPGGNGITCQLFFTNQLAPGGFNTGGTNANTRSGMTGFANAGVLYAGSQPQNSTTPTSVSQYDVACYQAAQHGTP